MPADGTDAAMPAWQTERVAAWGRVTLGAVFAVMLVVLGRVVQLKVAPDERLEAMVGSPFSSRTEMARRGDMLDRRGRVIATTTLGYRLFVDPSIAEDVDTLAVDICEQIGGDPVDLDRRIMPRLDRRYVVVKDELTSEQVAIIRQTSLRGVGLEPIPVRRYPFEEIGAALVGMVGADHTGLSGMEFRHEDRLDPARGSLTYLRDVRRRPLWIEPAGYRPGSPGADVRLSIDLVVQEIAQRRLDAAVDRLNAGGGRVVVMDAQSGELLAIYDRLEQREGWDEQTEDPLRERHLSLGRNRCVTDPYEPGSTFKPFTWSVATQLGRVQPGEVLPTPTGGGHRTSSGRRIRDFLYYGPSTWRKVLIKSMNSGMAIVAERMTHAEMRTVITRFGFGEPTGCGLPGESAGIITPAGEWTSYSQCSVAMGHEIGVTPLQMVRAFSAFCRDGTMAAPSLVAQRDGDEALPIARRAIDPEIARLTREVMRQVMTEGSGRRAQSELYALFGKSGTAQLPMREGGGYHEDRYVSSFIAGAPLEQPRLIVLCVIDDPDRARGHLGGESAGPVVRDIMEGALQYLGVAPDLTPEEDDADD